MYEMLAKELAQPTVSEPKHAGTSPRSAAKSAKTQ
jgi:hypothetical protein